MKTYVKLVKSPIGLTPKQKSTIFGLGLKKIGDEVFCSDDPRVRGMIKKVINFLKITTK